MSLQKLRFSEQLEKYPRAHSSTFKRLFARFNVLDDKMGIYKRQADIRSLGGYGGNGP